MSSATGRVRRLDDLVAEVERAWAHTDALWSDLDDEALRWREHEESSPIGWHLGHQAAVASSRNAPPRHSSPKSTGTWSSPEP